MNWHVIEIIQVRIDDDMGQNGSTESSRRWSDLGNILKLEAVKLTDGLTVRHARERRVKDDDAQIILVEDLGAF